MGERSTFGPLTLHEAALAMHRPRALVVDDDEDIRRLLVRMLASSGCDVGVAANGVEALGILEDGSSDHGEYAFDAVVSDLSMPRMTLSAVARAAQPDVAATMR